MFGVFMGECVAGEEAFAAREGLFPMMNVVESRSIERQKEGDPGRTGLKRQVVVRVVENGGAGRQ
jgi:hypothetical protein